MNQIVPILTGRMFTQPKSVCAIRYCVFQKYPKGAKRMILIQAGM